MAILEYECSVHEITWMMSYLDCLISLSSCAKSFNFTRPNICEGHTLKATQVRHPLQELLVEHFIPNDIFLDSNDSLKIVTGHNGSGKSVYLKMVGLLQYMAQIGSFVPAEKAEIGLVTKIFTRIQSVESATVSHSSFTIDCNQMAWMLNHGDDRSLFLIDEFGKGTAELDGIALLSSTINYLAKKRFANGRPRVVLTTHFLEIFRYNLLEPKLIVDSQAKEEQCEGLLDTARIICTVMASTDALNTSPATSSADPLYELRHGISSHSNALGCASKCGIPQEVIKRAQEVMDYTKRKVPIPPRQMFAGPSPEEQLIAFFSSIDDWQAAGDDVISKFLTMARVGTQ
ncbi:putative DNA mismatch repair protein MutS [Plasmopara halstedii]